jgi:hypothetical protein
LTTELLPSGAAVVANTTESTFSGKTMSAKRKAQLLKATPLGQAALD